jgi:succinate dehydrogenase / fumarate reductase flavoprotein subunit
MEKYAPEKMELAPRDVVSRAITKEILEGRGVGPNKDAVAIDLTHLGEEIIMERLPELRDLAITFLGQDMIKEPIHIAATAHYSMGGIPVDIDGHVRKNPDEIVRGFYAAGECACVSVHGANRLGANSLLEALFFGRHVGKHIAEDLDNNLFEEPKVSEADAQTMLDEIAFCLNNNGDERVPELRKELQESMTANAGVFRTEETMLKQREILKDLRARYKKIRIDDKSKTFNTDLQEAIEFGHMLDYSTFIVEGAIARKESRGAHYREDYPTRDDKNFLKHTFATMDKEGNVSIGYADVTLGKFEPQERKY